ncbi:bfd5c576-1ffb-4676-bfb7-cc708ea3e183 [Sclerotinia trifoliorum]|uniref:Bfd5c576-1ffb-4676-bfb7-cc708ea3e183 n=1 Tax=Sclerotinia trifoliorum TaxID=28548 RepID=A0A8H2W4W6_9HELO|nr:bfd5c576-1ffb-4676-bfb7-cc708ea3e183 [Sclerotinia trifoliorum]
MVSNTFYEGTRAEFVHALRILNAKFQALECNPVFKFATSISNDGMNGSDSDTSSVTSNSSATTDSSTFTNLTKEGDLEPLPLWNQISFPMERIIERVPWEEFIAYWKRQVWYDEEKLWTEFGLRTLKPCVETEEQHKYNKVMRCITCNTQLCESCAQSITNHIHGYTRADQEHAIPAPRVSYPCDLDGCKDMP